MSVRKVTTKSRMVPVAAPNPSLSVPMNSQPVSAPATEVKLTMDDLTETEQAAASLGVQPDSLVGLSWLNNAHHEQLVKANALSDDLARRIEAYRQVSAVAPDVQVKQ